MRTEYFDPRHLSMFRYQGMQSGTKSFGMEDGNVLASVGPAITGFDDDGNVVGCAGLWLRHEGVAEAWAVLSERCVGALMVSVTRAVRRFISDRTEHRIQALVLSDWKAGRRWVEMLGFQYEGTLLRYTPNALDCDMYARAGGRYANR